MARRYSIQAGVAFRLVLLLHSLAPDIRKPGTEQMRADDAARLSVDGVTPA